MEIPPGWNIKRTRLASAVAERLSAAGRAVVTRYGIYQTLLAIAAEPDNRKLLRASSVDSGHVRRVIDNLHMTLGLGTDPDYHRNVYRVLTLGDVPAEEVFALVTPFGYISHLSAMQWWGLTVRRPDALHLTLPTATAARALIEGMIRDDLGDQVEDDEFDPVVRLTYIQPPEVLRNRKIVLTRVGQLGSWVPVQGLHARLATIGQTFLDMLDRPDLCGGMAHICDVWGEHAETYFDDIVTSVDEVSSPIVKVRAGYLLDELLGMAGNKRIEGWRRFAQRGGSRVLDPAKPFSPMHSEKWMISLNV